MRVPGIIGRRPLYTPVQREAILSLRRAGLTIRAIADEVGVNKTSVGRICLAAEREGAL